MTDTASARSGWVLPAWWAALRDRTRGGGLVTPSVLLLVAAFVGPLVILVLYSFGVLGRGVGTGLGLYREVWGDAYFRGVIISTLQLGFMVTLITLLLGYPVAAKLARTSGRRRTLMTALLITPLLTNIVVRTLGWLIILANDGPLNSALGALLQGFSYRFLGSFTGIAIALVHVFLPFMVLPMVNTIEQIPSNVREASVTHGAHPIITFFRVTLPLSMPGIVAGSTLVFLLSTGALVTPMILGQGRVQVLSTLIFDQIQIVRWGRAGALAMTLFVIALTVIMIAQWVSQRAGGGRPRRTPEIVDRPLQWIRSRTGHALSKLPSLSRFAGTAWRVHIGVVFVFLFIPLLMVIKTAFDTSQVIHAGFDGFTLQWFGDVLADQQYISALLLSLRLAALGVVVGMAIGLPAAYDIVHGRFPGRNAVLAFLLSPLTLPKMVLAVGFVLFFQFLGARPSFTRLLVVHLVITMPYLMRVLVSAFEGLDPSLEEAARMLGANRLTAFRRISLPLLKPAIFAASLFGFLVSFDEVTVTVLVAGTQNQTLPVRMFGQLTQQWTPVISALSTLLVGVTVVSLVAIERFVGVSEFNVGRV